MDEHHTSLKVLQNELHRPGIEPGPPAWQASILPLNQRCRLSVSYENQQAVLQCITYLAVVAEWLRRLTRNQFPSGSVGSNPTDRECFSVLFCNVETPFR